MHIWLCIRIYTFLFAFASFIVETASYTSFKKKPLPIAGYQPRKLNANRRTRTRNPHLWTPRCWTLALPRLECVHSYVPKYTSTQMSEHTPHTHANVGIACCHLLRFQLIPLLIPPGSNPHRVLPPSCGLVKRNPLFSKQVSFVVGLILLWFFIETKKSTSTAQLYRNDLDCYTAALTLNDKLSRLFLEKRLEYGYKTTFSVYLGRMHDE